MIPHDKAKEFLRIVYKSGLEEAKRRLSEQAKTGDSTSRRLLGTIGVYNQGVLGKYPRTLEGKETFKPAELVDPLANVLESRNRSLLIGRLVCELVESGLPTDVAINTLLRGTSHASD